MCFESLNSNDQKFNGEGMMQIRRFIAKDIQEALKQVREVMGLDAVILSTKTLKKPSFQFGLPQPSLIEVVAAIDRSPDVSTESSPISSLSGNLRGSKGVEETQEEEDRIIDNILSTGLSSDFVHSLVKEIQGFRREYKGSSLSEIYRGLLRWKVMENVEVTGPASDGTKIWAFIGPTGVGKTTTLVKLAAHFSLKFTKKITLITIDTYRIGAVEQLKTYAEILRLPLEVAHDREGLREIIKKNIHQDFLFIDTAGRNPNHANQIEELKDFLTVHPCIENHLLLSATTKEKDLRRMIQAFSLLPIRSYLFTKIDETEEYGPLFNQLFLFKRPLSYLTNGQRVPEDIELATKVKVASLVMNQIRWN